MNTIRTLRQAILGLATTALVCGGVGLAGLSLGAGTARAAAGPYHWCPGDRLPAPTIVWDMSVCHTYYIVARGQGNTAGSPLDDLWDGDNPPAAPPPNCGPLPCALLP
jgi:hypothetical protein